MVRAPAVFGGGAKPTLEIRPDAPFVVLKGPPADAPDVDVTGTILLTTHDYMSIKSIKVVLSGVRKISWLTKAVNPQQIVDKTSFLKFEQYVTLTDGNKSKSHKLGPGPHEWRYKFKLEGSSPESIEGLSGSYIVYNLYATVDRGAISSKLTATKHLRVLRALNPEEVDVIQMTRYNADTWKNKIYYRIEIPDNFYVFGSSITADFLLTPLKKGVTLGTVKMEIHEYVTMYATQGDTMQKHNWEAVVAKQEFQVPEGSEVLDAQDGEGNPVDEGYHFQLTLPLPKSLKKCRQTVDTPQLIIEHRLKTFINLHNPEGHTSQLLVRNDICLFISPRYPVGEDQTVSVEQRPDENPFEAAAAPPQYGEHQLDLLYNEIDTGGFSAHNSTANTPFYGMSRNPSSEDLRTSIDAVANGIPGSQLRSRLRDLTMTPERRPQSIASSGARTPHSSDDAVNPGDSPVAGPPDSHSGQSGGSSTRPSRDPSFQLGVPGPADYDMEALVRVPSYNTAVHTPLRGPVNEGLPTYNVATSRPSSPTGGHGRQAHSSSGHSTPRSPGGSLGTLTEEEMEQSAPINARRARSEDGTASTTDPSNTGSLLTREHHRIHAFFHIHLHGHISHHFHHQNSGRRSFLDLVGAHLGMGEGANTWAQDWAALGKVSHVTHRERKGDGQ